MSATYPSFPQILSSSDEIVDDIRTDRAVNGTVKARAFFPAVKRRFPIKHRISRTDLATLLAFYVTNRLLMFYFDWARDGNQYACLFDGPPKMNYSSVPPYVEVSVSLLEK